MLSVTNKLFMISVGMLNVVMLNVVMLSVVMLNVVAPSREVSSSPRSEHLYFGKAPACSQALDKNERSSSLAYLPHVSMMKKKCLRN